MSSMQRIPFNQLTGLKKFKDGGQAEIFTTPKGKLIKIYDSFDPGNATKTNKRLEALGLDTELYNGLKYFCAVPEVLIQHQSNQNLIGFQMEHFQDFNPLSMLLSKEFCVIKNKITIRQVANIFLKIHDCLSMIHSKGFLVGDLNDDNVLFKFLNKSVLIAFVDVESWAVQRQKVILPAIACTPTFCHPEIDENINCLKAYHDWYSFAVLLARSLIKDDPFNHGTLDDATMRSIKGDTQKHGITCWDNRSKLTDQQELYVKRFGTKLTETMQLWLKGSQRGIFPKSVLQQFISELAFCTNCKLEIHIDHIKCNRCGEKLFAPTPRTQQNQQPNHATPTNSSFFNLLKKHGG